MAVIALVLCLIEEHKITVTTYANHRISYVITRKFLTYIYDLHYIFLIVLNSKTGFKKKWGFQFKQMQEVHVCGAVNGRLFIFSKYTGSERSSVTKLKLRTVIFYKPLVGLRIFI